MTPLRHHSPLTISVLGTGYLGATHAACMAELGHTVIGYDINAEKIAALNAGAAPFHEPELDALIARHTESGRLRFTTDPADLASAQVHFICAGTPQRVGELAADMSQVHAAADTLIPYLRADALVVGKSTVPVGTAAALSARLDAAAGRPVMLAWNPEFLREGFAVQDTLTPDRLVFGLEGDYTDLAEELMRRVYETPLDDGTPLIIADWPTAELVKVSANAFLATKISFINAISEICEASGADVTKIADAIGLDDRIGRKFLAAGLGFGGGCLPKDIRAFQARATELGVGSALSFLGEIDAINIRRRDRAVDLARAAAGGDLTGTKITMLGATFKPNSDDVRDAPSLDVAARLHAAGAVVTVHDPEGIDNASRMHPQLGYQRDVFAAVTGADVLIVGTEWQHYRDLNPVKIAELVSGTTIIDARNTLNPALWRAAGFTYTGFGRPGA